MKYTPILIALLVLLLSANGKAAIRVDVRGDYALDSGEERGNWSGVFSIEGTSFSGEIKMGSAGANRIPVSGMIGNNRIVFAASKHTPEGPSLNFESEALLQNPIRGVFQRDGDKGRWSASVYTLSGQLPTTLPKVETEIDPIYLENNPEPEGPCAELADPRIRRVISGAGERVLRLRCDGRLGPGSARGLFSRVLAYAQELLGNYRSWALAQTPNTLGNDPSVDTYPLITQSETSLAVSGANSNIVLLGYNDAVDLDISGWSRSTNGGATFQDMGALAGAPNEITSGDPILRSNPFGYFFYAHLFYDTVLDSTEVGVSRSSDGGITFVPRVIVSTDPGDADRPSMAVDPNNDNIYVCWVTRSKGIVFGRSTNQGQTYNTPQQLSNPSSDGGVTACSIATGAGGDVFVAWYDNIVQEVRLRRSSNGGLSFLPEGKVGQAVPPSVLACCSRTGLNGNIRNLPAASIAADPLVPGRVFVTWDTFVNGSTEVMFASSASYGAENTWNIVQVNNNSAGDQFQPVLSATVWFAAEPDTTAVRVLWYDRRNDPSNLKIDAYSALTFDSGQTWQGNEKWTDVAFSPPQTCPYFECDSGTGDCYMGDYNSLAAFYPANSLFQGAWGDNRLPLASGAPSVCEDGIPRPSQSTDPNIRVSSVGC